MRANLNDAAAGGIFAAIGLLYAVVAYRTLPMGNAFEMGPGYVPFLLSAILVLIGIGCVVRSFVTAPEGAQVSVPWRALVVISLAIAVFALGLRALGLFPTVFISSFVASLAAPAPRLVRSLVTSACIAVACSAVFRYGLETGLPLFGTAFGGWWR